MFVSFLERYDGNGEYVQSGVSKFIDTAATKSITMKLRKTQVGQELLRMSNWIPQDSWRDMWSVQDIIAGLKGAYVRPLAQLFAEMDDIWERRLDDFEKSATVDPLHLTESVEDPPTTQAPSSKEMEIKCLDRFESILTGKINPKRFNDTTYYKEEKNWDMLTIVPPMTSRIVQESPGSLMVILSATIHALTVGRIIVSVCAS